MFCKLLILNYKITKNSEITNFLGYFLIPNWRNNLNIYNVKCVSIMGGNTHIVAHGLQNYAFFHNICAWKS